MSFISSLFGSGQKSHKLKIENKDLASKLIMDNMNESVILLDASLKIATINSAASTLLGWKKEDASGIDFNLVMNFYDSKNQKLNDEETSVKRFLSQNDTIMHETAYIKSKSESIVTIDINLTKIFDQSNNIQGLILVFRDVSKERDVEQKRADFISTASHEMRTPVAAIEGYLSLALNPKICKVDDKAKDYINKAYESSRHLGQLFQDLLNSSRAEDGRLVSHPAKFDFVEFLTKLTGDLSFAAKKKNLKVDLLIGSNQKLEIDTTARKVVKPIYYVYADPDRLREAVTNLFDNAVKYTDSGSITMSVTGNDDIVQFKITDTGIGIPAEDIGHLFQKFYRVDNSATRTIGGTGLGLFISKKIIELYAGKIWVESQFKVGTSFIVNLPRQN